MGSSAEGTAGGLPRELYLGTSSWSSRDWEGVFYPPGTPPGDYLSHYSTRFRTVEVDATFYRIPSRSLTMRWKENLPDGFLMASKAPRSITHEKGLEDAGEDLGAFLSAMDNLGDRLGPILFQFPYFRKGSAMTEETFLHRLRGFLPTLPIGYRFALEIRNRKWIRDPLLDLLRDKGVALALIDHPWMPRAAEYVSGQDPVTAGFAYVRWLGDRYGIEKKTRKWDRTILDRTREMTAWVPVIRTLLSRGLTVFGYFNNHYAGHAPASIELFERIWEERPER